MSQALASMTGFARATVAVAGATIMCELKSVNGRGLDIRLRVAPGLEALEADIRQLIAKMISRGSVTCTVSVEGQGAGGELIVNQQALETVLAAMERLNGRLPLAPSTAEGILALKGVLEQSEVISPGSEETVNATVLDAVSQALVDLVLARRREGAQTSAYLLERLDEIESFVGQADQHPARSREAILARLHQQIATIREDTGVPEERLIQEALVLATKADINEELERLKAHIESARQLINSGGAVGRRLDFLAQEFNREANTLCAKANAVELTAIGLDLKAAIDQLREQVQNIE